MSEKLALSTTISYDRKVESLSIFGTVIALRNNAKHMILTLTVQKLVRNFS